MGIGQNRRAAKPTAFQLALTQAQVSSQLQFLCQAGQGLLLHQIGAQPRQFAFLEAGEAPVQLVRNTAVEDAIAEKFKALVMRRAVAAMGQRLLQQGRLRKAVAQFAL